MKRTVAIILTAFMCLLFGCKSAVVLNQQSDVVSTSAPSTYLPKPVPTNNPMPEDQAAQAALDADGYIELSGQLGIAGAYASGFNVQLNYFSTDTSFSNELELRARGELPLFERAAAVVWLCIYEFYHVAGYKPDSDGMFSYDFPRYGELAAGLISELYQDVESLQAFISDNGVSPVAGANSAYDVLFYAAAGCDSTKLNALWEQMPSHGEFVRGEGGFISTDGSVYDGNSAPNAEESWRLLTSAPSAAALTFGSPSAVLDIMEKQDKYSEVFYRALMSDEGQAYGEKLKAIAVYLEHFAYHESNVDKMNGPIGLNFFVEPAILSSSDLRSQEGSGGNVNLQGKLLIFSQPDVGNMLQLRGDMFAPWYDNVSGLIYQLDTDLLPDFIREAEIFIAITSELEYAFTYDGSSARANRRICHIDAYDANTLQWLARVADVVSEPPITSAVSNGQSQVNASEPTYEIARAIADYYGVAGQKPPVS